LLSLLAYLGEANSTAKVGLSACAELALLALSSIKRDNVITNSDISDTLTDRFNNTTTFVTKDGRESTFGIYYAITSTISSCPVEYLNANETYLFLTKCRHRCGSCNGFAIRVNTLVM
jgi:hypothetical protein